MFRENKKPDRGFFGEFEKEFEEINKQVENMLRSTGKEPVFYGLSVRVGPDGVPHMQQFGNLGPMGEEMGEAAREQNVREPFTSSIIDEKKNELNITAEMPGICKEDIEVNSTESEVLIKAESEGRKYYKIVQTPCQVNPESAKANYNNGVLEITFDLKKQIKQNGKSIKIE